jgi:hypothetical protein
MRALVLVAALASACAGGYQGPARSVSPAVVEQPGWLRAERVGFVAQRGEEDCGLAAAAMIVAHHGGGHGDLLRRAPPPGGLSALRVRTLLRQHGLRAFVIAGELADLEHELAAGRPVVVGTVKRVDRRRGRPHYEVVVALDPVRRQVVTLDPAVGWRQSSYAGFLSEWGPARRTAIVALPPPEATTARVSATPR